MEVMEIVENEPTASRAFKCDWDGCNKVRNCDHSAAEVMDGITDAIAGLQPQVVLAKALSDSHQRAAV